MNLTQYLEMICNDSTNPCYYIDVETKKMVFMNQTMEKKFQIFENYSDTDCCSVVKHATGTCALCQNLPLDGEHFEEQRIFSDFLGQYLRANSTVQHIKGRDLLYTKFYLAPTDPTRAEAKVSFENAMSKSLEILAIHDLSLSIQAFLELIGEFYDCECAYIYESNKTSATLVQRYHWSREVDGFNHLFAEDENPLTHFMAWVENDHRNDIVRLDFEEKTYPKDSLEYKILEEYSFRNVTLSKLWNKDGSLLGIVGLGNQNKKLFDERLLVAISRFVVERFNEKTLIQTLENLNELDLLTGFFNRVKYAERLSELYENPPASLGVIFVNLNGLRKTNEYLGFEMGDRQIKNTSDLLREFYNEPFYRISGDEFVGFILDCDKERFEEKISKLQRRLKSDNHETTFSLGHSWDSGSYSVTNLVRMADTVMVINKQSYYFNSLKNTAEITNSILRELFRAISEEEFLVYLQPQINLETKEVVGAEALVRRFNRVNQKMIYPDSFIPLYEENSIIRHVDIYVLRKVCHMLAEWRYHKQELPISINFSRVTLMEHGIVKTISDIVDEYELPHSLIVIEITERMGMMENDTAHALVEEFQSLGFRLSLDDFGCAYSNIVTLAQISVDEVKIDKSLVDNLISNPKNRIIVKNMLLMCNEFKNTSSLAEGIETEEQAEFLRSVHCHLGQGYLYSRPIPNEDFYERYIKSTLDEKN